MAFNQLWLHWERERERERERENNAYRDIFSCHNLGRVLHPTVAGQQNYLAMCQCQETSRFPVVSLIVVSLCCSLQAQRFCFSYWRHHLSLALESCKPTEGQTTPGLSFFSVSALSVLCCVLVSQLVYLVFLFPVFISFWSLPLLRRSALSSFPFFPPGYTFLS